MGLQGIRLTDIYGYDQNDYDRYFDNNIESIKRVRQNSGYDSDDSAAADMYLNNLIKRKIGIEGFNANVRGKRSQDKLAYYNSLFKDDNQVQQNDTLNTNVSNTLKTNNDQLDYEKWYDGDTWTYSPESPVQQMTISEYFKQKASNKPVVEDPIQSNFQEIKIDAKKQREDLTDDQKFSIEAFDRLFDPRYTRKNQEGAEFNGTKLQKDIEDYTAIVRSKLDEDPEFTSDLFNQFEKRMLKNSYYYKNYHDSYLMPFTPNEMKDILAEYYSINTLKNGDEAQKFADKTFQNKVADTQGIGDKLTNGVRGAITNFSGSMLSFAGQAITIPYALIKTNIDQISEWEDNDPDNINYIQELLYNISNNPLTAYGRNLLETGVWLPSVQEQYKETGRNQNLNVREYGNESKFLDWNTAFDMIPQAAFTVAGMYQGQVASAILNGAVRSMTNPVSRKLMLEGSSNFTKKLGNFIDRAGNVMVMAGTALAPAASEAAVDAFALYDRIIDDGYEGIDNAVKEIVNESMENGEFQDYYNRHNNIVFPTQEEYNKLNEQQRLYVDMKKDENIEQIYNMFVEEKRNEIVDDPGYKEMIQKEAMRQAAKNLTDETMYIAFADMLFSKALGDGFKAAKKRVASMRGGSTSPYKLYRNSDGALRLAKENLNFWNASKAVGEGLVESVSEGVEEGFQNVDTELRNDLASNYVTQWILNRHDLATVDDITDSIFKNRDVVKNSLNENLFSDESIYSFWMGAASSFIGTPTIGRGIRHGLTSYVNGEATTFKEVAKDILENSYRVPVLDNIKDAKLEIANKNNEINAINRWLEDHDEVAKAQDFMSIYSWATKQQDTATEESDKDYRDAVMGQEIATLMMMERVGGTIKEKSFSKKLKEMTKLQESSEAAQSLIDQAITVQGLENVTEEQRHEIFNDIVSRSKELYQKQQDLKLARRWIQDNFGQILDAEAVDAWTYETLMHQDLLERVNKIDEFVKDAYKTSQNAKRNPREASPMDNFIARYGSLSGANSRANQLSKEIKTAKDNKQALKQQLGTFGYNAYISSLEEKLDNVKKDIKDFGESEVREDQVVLAENIAFLDTEARAELLNEKNKDRYSNKQLSEIKKFKSAQKIDKDVLQSIQDASDLLNRYNSFSKRFKEVQQNAQNAALYNNEVHREVVKRMATRGLKDAIEAKDYETFKTAVDGFKNDAKNEFYLSAIDGVLKDSPFYKDYVKELKDRSDSLSRMSKSKAFEELDNDKQRILTQAYRRAQQDNDTSFGNVYKYASDPTLIDNLGIKNNIDFDEFASQISEILQNIENHKINTERIKKLEEDLNKPIKGEPVANPVAHVASSNIFNTDYYTAHKNNINKIVSLLYKYLIGKKNSIKLPVDDFVSFMSMFSNESINNNLLVDITPSDLSMDSMFKLLEQINDSIESYKITHSDNNDAKELINTLRLKNAIENYISKYMNYLHDSKSKSSEAEYLRYHLSKLSPDLRQLSVKESPKPVNIGAVQIKVKLNNSLSYQAEKDYYSNNDINENLKTLESIVNSGAKPSIVLINDKSLNDLILSESGEEKFDSDNLPLVAAIIVQKDTKNSRLIDNQYVLPIGLIYESRPMADNEAPNKLNSLRQFVIDSNSYGLVKNVDGSIYQMKSLNIKPIRNTEESVSSIRDYLIDRFGNREAAIEAFRNGVVKVKLSKKDDSTLSVSYTDPYSDDLVSRTSDIVDGTWTDKPVGYDHTMLAYIDKNNPSKPIFLYERGIDEVSLFEDSEQGVFEVLNSDEDITADKYKIKDINNIRSAVTKITNTLSENIDKLITQGKATAKALSNKLTESLSDHVINFGKKARDLESPNKIDIRYNRAENKLDIYLLTEKPDDEGYNEELLASSEILTKDNTYGKDKIPMLKKLSQEAVKNLAFNKDGSPRMNSKGTYPLVKIQTNYNDAVNKDINEAGKLLLRNVFLGKARQLNNEIGEIDINPTTQNRDSEDTRKKSLQRLVDLMNTPLEVPDGYIQVTTFIKEDKEDDQKTKEEKLNNRKNDSNISNTTGEYEELEETKSVAEQVSLTLGTSADRMVRAYFDRKGGISGTESINKFMQDNKLHYWLGFGSKGNEQFNKAIREIKKIEDFFIQRDETVVSKEIAFTGEISDEVGRIAKLYGVPDIITVDKNGKYHIYDMKSFKYSVGATPSFSGFDNGTTIVRGLGSGDTKMLSWQKQLTLYKALLEKKFGDGCVASLGVIPIALDYKVDSSTVITANVLKAYDSRGQVFDIEDIDLDGNKKSKFHVNNILIPSNFIKIEPILDLSKIGSTKWDSENSPSKITSLIEAKKQKKDEIGHVQTVMSSTPVEEVKFDINEVSNDTLESIMMDLYDDNSDVGGLSDRINADSCGI